MKAKERGMIPKAAIEAARRKTKRRVASVIIRCMADEDMGFEQIGNRLDQPTETVRKWVYDLVEGIGKDLDEVSDLCLAMDREMEFGAQKIQWAAPSVEQSANADVSKD